MLQEAIAKRCCAGTQFEEEAELFVQVVAPQGM